MTMGTSMARVSKAAASAAEPPSAARVVSRAGGRAGRRRCGGSVVFEVWHGADLGVGGQPAVDQLFHDARAADGRAQVGAAARWLEVAHELGVLGVGPAGPPALG